MQKAFWLAGMVVLGIVMVFGSASRSPLADVRLPMGEAQSGSQIEIVKNPKVPLHRDFLSIREEAVIPQPGGPPESLLAGIGTIVVDQKGWIYIADIKDQQVKVYDPSGRFIRGIGKVGQAPGEYQELSSIFLTSGNELGLHDFQRQQVHYFSLNGRYLRSIQVPRKLNTGGGRGLYIDGQDNFFSLSQVRDVASIRWWHEAARMGKALERDDNLERIEQPTGEGAILKRLIICGRPAGGVVIGHTWEYLFRFYDSEGRLEKEVFRDFDPVLPSKEESDYWYRTSGSRSSYFSPFSDFVVDDRGWLIVKTPKRTAGRQNQVFDVFDEKGRFQAQMTLPTRDYLNDRFGWAEMESFHVENGRVYIVTEDDDGNLNVRRYAVTWPTEPDKIPRQIGAA
jgi:hypothetical protein